MDNSKAICLPHVPHDELWEAFVSQSIIFQVRSDQNLFSLELNLSGVRLGIKIGYASYWTRR